MSALARWWPLVFAGVVVLGLGVLVYLVALLFRSAQGKGFEEEEGGGPEPEPEEAPAAAPRARLLGRSFRQAVARIRRFVPGARPLYELPWYALVGAEGSRPGDLLARAGLDLPFGPPGGAEGGSGCTFWFLERGIVLDLAGDYLVRRDCSADEWGWRSWLRLLQRHRPRRPLDGVVVTLSAAELLAAAAGGTAAQVDLERRANLLYRKLWRAQRQLGMRWPVYVLVTGGEAVPGFAGLAGVLPEGRRHDVFGWSNPSALDTAYRPAWVDEAFATLDQRLARLQMEILAGRSRGEAADEVLRFPGALATLATPVRVVLDQLFKPSGYHESFLFRGLYFCGEASGPAGDAETFFLQGLFEHKIIREKNLGGPTRATLASRNRRVLAAQAALVVAGVVLAAGTVAGYRRLDAARDQLRPFLEEELREHAALERQAAAGGLDEAMIEHAATHLLTGVARLDFDHFRSFFLPASWPWFTGFDDRLAEAAIAAYDQVILEALFFRLKDRAQELTADPYRPADRFIAWEGEGVGPLSAAPPPGLAVPALERTREFVTLERLVAGLAGLEEHAELYNGLPATQDIEELGRLIDYLFGLSMPRSSARHAHLYRRALRDVEYERFRPADFRPAAAAKVETLANSLHARLFRDSELLAVLDELALTLDEMTRPGAPVPDPPQLALLVEQMERVEEVLARPELEWARRSHFDLGPGYAGLTASIETSAFLGREVAGAVRRSGEAGWWEFRRRLADLSAPGVGPLLEVEDGEPQLQLSPPALRLLAALTSLLDQSFLRAEEGHGFAPQTPPGALLTWDLHRLEEGARLEEAYQSFQSRTLALFPEAWQGLVSEVGRQAMGERIADLVGHAQGFAPVPEGVSPLLRERELAAAIASFGAAVKPLNQLMDLLARLRLGKLEQALSELVTEQGFTLLAAVDDLLVAGSPYAPRHGDFSWWDGTAPASLPAYGAADAAALAAYLDLERRRVHQLATQYAQPVVTWLGDSGRARQPEFRDLFLRWQGILLSLQEHEAKKPGNPVAVLEEFITAELAAATPARCPPAALPAALTGASSNFFLARRNELARQLQARCAVLTVERAHASYAKIARYFNDRLAGRFPFAAAPPGAFTAEADLADLREFFRLFDAGLAVMPARRDRDAAADGAPAEAAPACAEACAPGDPAGAADAADFTALGAAGPDVAAFYRQMCAVRCFFAPYLESPEPDPSFAVEVEVEFRVNRAEAAAAAGQPVPAEVELGGERIIGWELQIGDRRVGHRDADRRLTWRPGLPVRLSLRWAEDSPRLPARPFLTADDRTVAYEYADRWSLVSFVLSHPSSDPRRETLRFVVTTVDNPDVAGEEAAEPPTQVFVRLLLRGPQRDGKPGPVLAVPRFPTAAPGLGFARASR